MRSSLRSPRTSLFRKLLLAFVIASLAPALVYLSFVQFRVLTFLENEVVAFHHRDISFASEQMDTLFEDAIVTAIDISLRSELAEVGDFTPDRPYGAEQVFAVGRAVDMLARTIEQRSWIDSLYVLFPAGRREPVVLSNSGVSLLRDFADTAWIADYRAARQRIRISPTRVPLDPGRDDPSRSPVVTVVVPVQTYTPDEDTTLVAVNIRRSALRQRATVTSRAGYAVQILDARREILFETPGAPADEAVRDYVRTHVPPPGRWRSSIVRTGTSGVLVTAFLSHRFGLTYVCLTEVQGLLGGITDMRRSTLLITAVILAVGIVFSLLASRRIYLPLNTVLRRIASELRMEPGSGEGELALIGRAFERVVAEEKWIENLRTRYARDLEEGAVLKLMQGGDGLDPDLLELAPDQAGCFVAAAIDRYDEFREKYSDIEQHYYRRTVFGYLEEALAAHGTRCRGVVLPHNLMAFALVLRVPAEQSPDDAVAGIASALQSRVRMRDDLSVSLGFGTASRDAARLARSANESLRALQHKLIRGDGSVTLYSRVASVAYRYYYPLEIESHILNYLRLGMERELVAAVRSLVADLKTRAGLSVENAQAIMMDVIGGMLRQAAMSGLRGTGLLDNAGLFEELAHRESLDSMARWIEAFLARVFEQQRLQAASGNGLAGRLAAFVDAHCADPALDITRAADGLGISYRQVRRLAEKSFGVSFLTYVNRIRVERAKKLLAQGSARVEQVARSVGYANTQSFARFFKKYEGMPPGRFRSAGG